MIVLRKLSHIRIRDIANEMAHSVMFTQGGLKDELGVGYTDRMRSLSIFYEGIIRIAYRKKALYTTSANEEGYLLLLKPQQRFTKQEWLQVYAYMAARIDHKIMRNFLDIVRYNPGLGVTFDLNEVCEILFINVKKEFQGSGIFKQIIQFAQQQAKEAQLDLVVSADCKQKSKIYNHVGFETINVRRITNSLVYYDLQFITKG